MGARVCPSHSIPVAGYSFLRPLFVLSESPFVDLLKAVPTVWDETLVLPCTEMGEVVAYARRKGKEWWIGVMNGDKEREIEIPLDFLKKKKQAVFLHDGKELASVVREEREVSKKEVLKVKLRAGGGFVLCHTVYLFS